MQHQRILALSVFGCAFWACSLHAEQIFLKNQLKPIVGTIKSESSLGVFIEGRSEIIPAGEIIDIQYKVIPSNTYLKAWAKDKEIQDKDKGDRYKILLEARSLYDTALKEIDPELLFARRNIEFRIALLRTRLSIEFNKSTELALQNLSDFKTKHKDGWQTAQCLQLLASMQLAHGKHADAEKTFIELTQAAVPNDVKLDAEFQAAQIGLRTGNFTQALTRLEGLAAKLPKNSTLGLRVLGAQAECLAGTKKVAEAGKLLKQLIKDSSDKNVKAMAHNTLGKIYYDQGQLKEARWEFLWVDVLFNQDKAEQAKALYYLGNIFDKLGEAERAQECRDSLLNDRRFAGLEFQLRAQAEMKR